MKHNTKIFVNLPVKNLKKSMDFFTKLGYKLNPKYTDQNAACLIISKDIYAMLLVKRFFKTFIKKEIANAAKATEVIIALTVGSRKKVDQLVEKALAAGGKSYRQPDDHGLMYTRSFQDLDGHLWEIFYMDENAIKKN